MEIMETGKKYIRVYSMFIKNALITLMEYRANFFISFAVECLNFFFKIIYVLIIYKSGVTIEGISQNELQLFVGVYIFLSGIIYSFFLNNFNRLSEYVKNGDLDLLITKPISLQFLVTMRYIDFGNLLPNLVGGGVMFFTAYSRLDLHMSFSHAVAFIALLIGSMVVSYAIMLIPSILSLWIVRTWGFYESVVQSLLEFNNMPMQIYHKHIVNIGVFMIPVLVITNFPVLFLLNKMPNLYLVWAAVVPFAVFFLSRLFWKFAIKRYVSASS
ncbi:ABC-2 family transporter protein [Paenibacillus polysaccharolyticus]|uniref:ABC transporter permease n=1 Tax=Paenibacillus polysaccharolyticus TaxID=582692 RepID=UPI00203F9DA8|nr:ABC-2 family transporter protein [Paenibacillus polysaccharolyticus]MCM3132889.1 ABC-2 family transporter protein [Paenibacillus polysaccharolyticus]